MLFFLGFFLFFYTFCTLFSLLTANINNLQTLLFKNCGFHLLDPCLQDGIFQYNNVLHAYTDSAGKNAMKSDMKRRCKASCELKHLVTIKCKITLGEKI